MSVVRGVRRFLFVDWAERETERRERERREARALAQSAFAFTRLNQLSPLEQPNLAGLEAAGTAREGASFGVFRGWMNELPRELGAYSPGTYRVTNTLTILVELDGTGTAPAPLSLLSTLLIIASSLVSIGRTYTSYSSQMIVCSLLRTECAAALSAQEEPGATHALLEGGARLHVRLDHSLPRPVSKPLAQRLAFLPSVKCKASNTVVLIRFFKLPSSYDY